MAVKAANSVTVFDVSDGITLGTNILRNTNSMTNIYTLNDKPAYYWENAGWRSASNGLLTRSVIDITDCPDTNIVKGFRISGKDTNSSQSHISQDKIPLKVGETYTMSCYARATNIDNGAQLHLQWWKDSNHYSNGKFNLTTDWVKYSKTFTPNEEQGNIYFGCNPFNVKVESNAVEICGMKVEIGSNASAWTDSEIFDTYNVSSSMTTCINGSLHIEVSRNGILSAENLYAEIKYRSGNDNSWVISTTDSGIITGSKNIAYTGDSSGYACEVLIYKDSSKAELLCSGSCSTSANGETGQRGNLEFSGTEIYGIRAADYNWPLTNISPIENDNYVNSLTGDRYKYTSENKWHWENRIKSDNDDGNAFRFFSPTTHYSRTNSSSKNYNQPTLEDGLNPFGKMDSFLHYHVSAGENAECCPYYTYVKVDNTHTYRYSCYVKVSDKNSAQYFGIRAYSSDGDPYIETLSGGVINSGYFSANPNIEVGKWYLVIGYVVGNGETEQPADNGVYDIETGKKVFTCNGRRWKSSVSDFLFTGTRLGYNASTHTKDSDVYIYDIRFDDMTECKLTVKDLLESDTGNNIRYFGSREWSTKTIHEHISGEFDFQNNEHVTVDIGDTLYIDITNTDTGRKGILYITANESWSDANTDWGTINCSIQSYSWGPAPVMPNLVPDFAFGWNGWTLNNVTCLLQGFDSTINKHYIEYQKTANNNSYTTTNRIYFSNTGFIESGKYYTISFWAKSIVDGQSLRVSRSGADNATVNLTTTWTRYSVNILATDNGNAISFMPYKMNTGVFLADIKMEVGDVETSNIEARSSGIYQPSQTPTVYTTAVYGTNPTHRIQISSVSEKIRIGDSIQYENMRYSVCSISPSYYYLNNPIDLQGEDGNGIESITYYYGVTNDQNVPSPSSITSTSIPEMSLDKRYLWQKEVISYTNIEDKVTVALISVYGPKGDTGKDGTSVRILGEKSSSEELPTSDNEIGDGYIISGDLWVWTAAKKWEDVGRIQGPQGESATQYYIHYVYCDEPSSGENYSTNISRRYVGIYTDDDKNDKTTFSDLPSNVVWSILEFNENLTDGNTVNTIKDCDTTSWHGTKANVEFDETENIWKMSSDNGTTGSAYTIGIIFPYFEDPEVGETYSYSLKYKIIKKEGTSGTIADGYDFRFYLRNGTSGNTGTGPYKAINKESNIEYGVWKEWKGSYTLSDSVNKLRFMARIYRLGGYEFWIKDLKIEKSETNTNFCLSKKDSRGNEGPEGNGIDNVTYFYKATSAETQPEESEVTATNISDTTFSATDKYLWQKEVISYTKNDTPKVEVALIGVYGSKGDPGSRTFINDYPIREFTNEQWETRIKNYDTTTDNGYLQKDITDARINDIMIIPCILTEQGRITGQIYTRVTGISTTKTSSGYYKIATTALFGVTGEKGESGDYTINVPIFCVTNSTASTPNKPSDRVTSTSAASSTTWTTGKYTGYRIDKSYYTCIQKEKYNSDGEYQSCEWSAVTKDVEYENAGKAKLTADGKYLGTKTAIPTGYSSTSNFDWFLANFTKTASTTYDQIVKGNVYAWNGSKWARETNTAHLNVCMADMMNLVDDITEESTDVWAVATVFAQTLAAKKAFVDDLIVHKISSSNWKSPESKSGYYMDGEIEYHYGEAVYDSDYIKIGYSGSKDITALGHYAAYGCTEDHIIAIGYKALYTSSSRNNNCDYNIAIGYECLSEFTNGKKNIAIGYGTNFTRGNGTIALGNNINLGDATRVVAIGGYALTAETEGTARAVSEDSVYIGYGVASKLSGSYKNVCIGANAQCGTNVGGAYGYNTIIGYSAALNTEQISYNTVVGAESLQNCISGKYNTVLGYKALNKCTGDYNISIGPESGNNITSGNNNICIGNKITPISNIMDYQMNFQNRLIYLEFTSEHYNIDVWESMKNYIPDSVTRICCMGFYKNEGIYLIRRDVNQISFYDYSADPVLRIYMTDTTTKLTGNLVLFFPNHYIIDRNEKRPLDIIPNTTSEISLTSDEEDNN